MYVHRARFVVVIIKAMTDVIAVCTLVPLPTVSIVLFCYIFLHRNNCVLLIAMTDNSWYYPNWFLGNMFIKRLEWA